MDPGIEIRHLRYFLAVAETENFTRAAERLAVTQPSVSQQMKELEKRLGTPLFARFGQRVRLTEAGRAFRKHAEVVLRKLDEACTAVSNVAGAITGHLDVGVIPALHLAWVPPVLEHIARDHLGLTVAVHERASHFIETEIEIGRLDLGLGITSRTSPNIRYRRLITEKLALIVPPDHGFARRPALAVRELEGVPLVLLPESFDMRHVVNEVFHRARLRPKIAFENGTIDSTLKTVLHARTPTLLPPIALKGREALGLHAVKLSGRVRPMEFGLLWPRGSDSPAARIFAGLLKRMIDSPRRRPGADGD